MLLEADGLNVPWDGASVLTRGSGKVVLVVWREGWCPTSFHSFCKPSDILNFESSSSSTTLAPRDEHKDSSDDESDNVVQVTLLLMMYK